MTFEPRPPFIFPQGLTDRPREVFRHLVEAYLASGEPVGSRTLSQRLPVALSPASIRNVMADLEAMGLLYAPPIPAPGAPPPSGACACSWTACWRSATWGPRSARKSKPA